MFHNFGFETASLFEMAEKEREKLKHPYVGSEHLLLAILKRNTPLSSKLKNVGLTYQKFKQELMNVVGSSSKTQELVLYTPLLKRIIETAMEDAEENNKGVVTEEHLFLAMLEEGEGIAIRIMIGLELDLEELYDEIRLKKRKKEERENLEIYKIGNILNDTIEPNEKIVGREKELDIMIETLLRKKKNNPLLVGKAGIGKSALVEQLARKIKQKQVPEELENATIVALEMGSLVAGTKYRGEFEERLTKLIKEIIHHPNIILFIDEIHSMVSAGGAEGAINASDILKPYLARGDIKCIGATTIEEYHQYIEKDKALERRFEVIQMEEPTLEETKYILKSVKKEYENHHHVTITSENIEDIVFYANQYIYNRQNPDKSLELLDSICARVKTKRKDNTLKKKEKTDITPQKEKCVREGKYKEALALKKVENEQNKKQKGIKTKQVHITKNDILEVIELKTKIPMLQNRQKMLEDMEKNVKEKIIGQDQQIEMIMKMIREKEMHSTFPLSFLLLGPTGVGKTETVKQIAKYYGGSENFLRLDMSEYALDTSIHKLIGSPKGYVGYEDGYVFQKIKENPYRVLLLDEFEKSSPAIWNLFLQILDEGFITDSQGEKIFFNKTMIFMTSNAIQKNKVGFISVHQENEIFSRELLGRISCTVNYNKITKDIAKEYLKKYTTEENIEKILLESEYEKYGLRNFKYLLPKPIQEKKIRKIAHS